MKPQPSLRVCQVLDMKQELTFGFLDVVWPVQYQADLGEGQDAHHEGIVPQLLFVLDQIGNMLEAALVRARHIVHRPLCPGVEVGKVVCLLGFVKICCGKQRGHGVDVLGGANPKSVFEPLQGYP